MNIEQNASLPTAIIGFGAEGKSTLNWLLSKKFTNIHILDKNPVELPQGQTGAELTAHTGANYLSALSEMRIAIRSAGVNPMQQEILKFQMNGGYLTSQVELFFSECSNKIIGVTGTLGKGSCVSLISHCLNACGKNNAIGGNYGVPALDLLTGEERIIVLELSSFQLMTLGASPPVAIVLNVTSEHLDWHKTVEEYRDAKANLVRWQRKTDLCIYNSDSQGARQISLQSPGTLKPYSVKGEILDIDGCTLNIKDCAVIGKHQLQNIAPAIFAAAAVGCDINKCMEAVKTWRGLPLRLETVAANLEVPPSGKRLTFYNDSYSTRPEASIAAAGAMTKPFSMILGGSEKNADFSELAESLSRAELLQYIALIGNTAQRLEVALGSFPLRAQVEQHKTLESAFDSCLEHTPNGGAVLLSPACASFGLFANYKQRGEAFNNLVKKLYK